MSKEEPNNKGLIVISALEEAAALKVMLPKLFGVFKDTDLHVDVVVVDDGSRDNTAEVAHQCGAIVLTNHRNMGKMYSVHRAMKEVFAHYTHDADKSYDWLVTCDGDGQHPVESVVEVIEEIRNGVDVVFTSRYSPDSPDGIGNVPVDRQLLNRAICGMIDAVVPWELTDPLCGLRGFKPPFVTWILRQSFVTDSYGHEIETLLRLWHRREVEKVEFTFKELLIPPVYEGAGKISTIYGLEFLHHRAERARMHLEHITLVLDDLGIKDLRSL